MRGGGFGSVKGIFSKNISQSNVRPENQIVLYGIIPDALIDAHAIPQPKDFHITKIHGKDSLVEVKGLSSHPEINDRRACQSDRFGYRESRGFIGCEIYWFNGFRREKKVLKRWQANTSLSSPAH
jgi:hypothetical protein